ncbi:MAG: hypothetical protein OES84_01835 [Kiritimatiellaceae bacterium]|nr:hypothetical protein [Kiritimatiellaceae bacterium]
MACFIIQSKIADKGPNGNSESSATSDFKGQTVFQTLEDAGT